MRAIPWKLWLLAVLSAALQMLPFPLAGPVPLWRRAFCWVCLTPLLWAVIYGKNKQGSVLMPAQAAWLGYACGVVWYAGNCYWIYQTMYLYGGLPKPVALGILILFSLYLGLYHALFAGVLAWLRKLYSPLVALCVAPFLWVAIELARGRITGFPWDLLGYMQVDNLWLTKLAPFTGVMGISLVIAAVNCLWLTLAAKRRMMRIAWPAVTVLFIGYATANANANFWKENKTGSAVLLQENLGVGIEGLSAHESKDQMIAAFSALSLHPTQGDMSPPQLVIWPEAPTSFVDSDPDLRNSISVLAQQMQATVIVNDVSFASRNSSGRYDLYNSASFFLPNGSYAGRYDKIHLVPFGEYTPFKPLFFFVGHLLDDLPFIPGRDRTVLQNEGKPFGVFICYESIFGDEIRQFTLNGAQVLVNISDDGWYGDTSAPWEHLDMARMRAIENHRWLLRSTNTGVTAAINPIGQITEQLPRHIRGSLAVTFAYENDLTFYTRHGDWLAWLCALLSLGILIWGLVRGRFTKPVDVH
jgi:apolipoprotein N-acyltransferase